MTTSERIAAARRERRVLARVSRAAWQLEQAERERTSALISAHVDVRSHLHGCLHSCARELSVMRQIDRSVRLLAVIGIWLTGGHQ